MDKVNLETALTEINQNCSKNFKEALDIAKDAVDIKAKVLWLQLGIKSEQAKKLVIKNKIEYIEDRCTKMEYQKHFLKIRQAFPVLQD